MSRLFVAPLGDDWQSRFQETVATPVSVPEEAAPALQQRDTARIWGTTEGQQKRTYFEAMDASDPVLFYDDGAFFAAGRVGTAFENPAVGEASWGSSESRFIYTTTDHTEIRVERETIADLLGYEDT